jgi:hypothetical protein
MDLLLTLLLTLLLPRLCVGLQQALRDRFRLNLPVKKDVSGVCILLYVCPLTTVVRISLYVCPHTATYICQADG